MSTNNVTAEAYAEWFGKPVAIQLKVPTVMFDAAREKDTNEFLRFKTESGEVYGQPRAYEGGSHVVGGSLAKAADGEHLLLTMTSPKTGARMQMMLAPADIQYVWAIVRVPEHSETDKKLVSLS